jgi:iron(III) transport system ATP-binding protein
MGGDVTQGAALIVDGLHHAYGARAVLRDISFDARRGEIVCLLGRSGCGKTTLLRMIAGLETPDAGVISLNGRNLTHPDAFVPPERRGVGFMFQDYALFPHLTVLENAIFGAKAGQTAATALLERVGLGTLIHCYPHTLSAGEQQRAALVRALLPRPEILLMDEPFSNLDASTRESVRGATLALLRETRTTAIVVTHDPAEAMAIADRIVLMEGGAILQVGTPEDLYCRPTTLAAARYFSALNEISGTCSEARVTTPLGTFAAPDAGDGPVVACIRPQHIRVTPTGISARVGASTFLGEETLLDLHVGGTALTAKLPGAGTLKPGQDVTIAITEQDVLFFPLNHAQGDTHAP